MSNKIWFTCVGAIFGSMGAVCLFIGKWELMLICVISGAVVGLFYGIHRDKEERNAENVRKNMEEARQQRTKWLVELKQYAIRVNNIHFNNNLLSEPLVSTTYKANAQMNEIINELIKVSEKQGKVDSIVEELSKKGGASL